MLRDFFIFGTDEIGMLPISSQRYMFGFYDTDSGIKGKISLYKGCIAI